MKAVQISKPGGNFEVVERPIPQPARGEEKREHKSTSPERRGMC
jgi:hypothetical protein